MAYDLSRPHALMGPICIYLDTREVWLGNEKKGLLPPGVAPTSMPQVLAAVMKMVPVVERQKEEQRTGRKEPDRVVLTSEAMPKRRGRPKKVTDVRTE